MNKILKKHSIGRTVVVVFFAALAGFTSCSEDIDNSNLYTFTGETINDFLQKDSTRFSNFSYILHRVKLDKLLSAYGTYTCFAPTNDAVQSYIDSLYDDTTNKLPHNGMTSRSLAGLTDSLCNDIAKFHLAYTEVETVDMTNGLTIGSMLGRDLNTSIDKQGNTCVNTYSKITSADNKVENGVVQVLSDVLTRSNRLVAGEMERLKQFSIFYQALQKTCLVDSLSKQKKTGLLSRTSDDNNQWVPEECKVGYTIFAETNEVMSSYGIKNLDDLIAYANKVYGQCANGNAGWYDYYIDNDHKVSIGDDYTSRYNTLNMFVRYHILPYSVSKDNLTFGRWAAKGTDRYNQFQDSPINEYCETMLPYTLFKVDNVNDANDYYINRYVKNSTLTDNIDPRVHTLNTVEDSGVTVDKGIDAYQALNGYIHTLGKMLVYDKDVPTKVLNERIRFDINSRLWETMSNSQRGMLRTEIKPHLTNPNGNGQSIGYPTNYFDNLVVYNGNKTRLNYNPNVPYYLCNQADEGSANGAFDFAFRLPPVPDGTYELRIGYTANMNRGMVQFYIGNSSDINSMRNVGNPIDMRAVGTESFIGWTQCRNEDDYGFQTDKEMCNRGYMRGGLSIGITYGSTTPVDKVFGDCYWNARTLDVYGSRGLRLIIDRRYFKQGPVWLRCKSTLPKEEKMNMYLDYFELCPVSVYNNNSYFEDMW